MTTKNISPDTQTKPLLLNVSNTVLHVSASEFDSLCLDNPDLRLELTKDQELIVMSPQNVRSVRRLRRLAMLSHRAAVADLLNLQLQWLTPKA
ncbi:MAG: hypothetical protein RLZZ69_2469 [Cyanobacteriota bacterium]|jgi:Uma2 family endonuclease